MAALFADEPLWPLPHRPELIAQKAKWTTHHLLSHLTPPRVADSLGHCQAILLLQTSSLVVTLGPPQRALVAKMYGDLGIGDASVNPPLPTIKQTQVLKILITLMFPTTRKFD